MIRCVALMLALSLSACGLRPLYSGGSSGPIAQTLQGIAVAPIAGGKSGWLVQNALTDRLGSGESRWRLEVELDDRIDGFGIRADDAVTRERRTLRARYRLLDAQGAVLLDATAGSDIGIDVVSSDYATIAAENTALERLAGIVADQIVARVALYAQANPGS
ncbi:MAG: LPS assembly lipoprotein LptE [Sphingomonadaceae bacterium]